MAVCPEISSCGGHLPPFRLMYNTVSHHCNDQQGRKIKRCMEEANAVEMEKNGKGGAINVYNVMHLVK